MTRPRWSYHDGGYGCRVTVYQDAPGSPIYMQVPTGRRTATGKPVYQRRSLKHADRDLAERQAREERAKLQLGLSSPADTTATVDRVFRAYLKIVTPGHKSATTRSNDTRVTAMWTRILGKDFDLAKLSDTQWRAFVQQRQSGEVDAHGEYVPPQDRKLLRARRVAADLEFLRAVLNWAHTTTDETGRFYLAVNPIRTARARSTNRQHTAFSIPREQNPRRPLATEDRFEKTLAVAGQAHPDLPDLLLLMNATGHRLSSVLHLRVEDWIPGRGKFGSLRWRAAHDKMGKERLTKVAATVRPILERRVAIQQMTEGGGWLFPAEKNRQKPVHRRVAYSWLMTAEALAKLPKLKGGLWHPYRRKWATERKGHPLLDTAHAGGWTNTRTLEEIYLQDDPETEQVVVSQRTRELREAQE